MLSNVIVIRSEVNYINHLLKDLKMQPYTKLFYFLIFLLEL